MSNGQAERQVRRRRVFYIPGYDPIHPRRYRELYRKEGTEQARISGYEIGLVGRQGGASYGWQVSGRMEGATSEAEFDVLVWSDIVRDSMDLNIAQTYLLMARTAWTYISTGALRRLMRLRKGPLIAALYPVGMLILQALVALLVGAIAAMLAMWLSDLIARRIVDFDYLFGPFFVTRILLSLLLGAAAAVLVLRYFRKIDNRLFVYYLMHDYAYSARSRGANPPALEARLAEFTEQIAAALDEDVDEVLIVGHSSGAHLAISILADLDRAGRLAVARPALGLVTLGQVVPMVSFLPDAKRLRRDLHDLSTSPHLFWLDVTAPGDGCAFALCDPVAVSGVAPEGKRWPIVISAAFTQTLSPKRWAELRWRFFRLHFQYLCAFDRPGDYDYFRITAGPRTLADRFEGRPPSKSRIDAAVSKYTDMA
ncbi:hypothetical protein [Maritimibacter dapengensis]|uniref:Alpha/beta hydrolase family protein n=1 Tax=Maritimibacter dapengensis TaxID=2836868 RepID=A0ABS6T2W0_9RHOB|nr:hypothetical protein [Maritimibacter dapengensis]MBV7379535.1 hypothetical protein [Maritimibacter dapengensis]